MGRGGRGHATEGMKIKQNQTKKTKNNPTRQSLALQKVFKETVVNAAMVWLSALQPKLSRIGAMPRVTVRNQRGEAGLPPGALTLLAWVRVRRQLHVVGGEEPHLAVDFSSPPVGVVLVEDVDDLALAEGQFVVVLGAVVVHADHLAHCGRQGRVRAAGHAQGVGVGSWPPHSRAGPPLSADGTRLSGSALRGFAKREGIKTKATAESHTNSVAGVIPSSFSCLHGSRKSPLMTE